MRPRFLLSLLLSAVASSLSAAPPVNDQFAARISLAGSVVHTTGTNIEATEEAGENLQQGLFGATVWWSWIAPSAGWVRVDTEDSDFDTVLQISTGGTLTGQAVIAFNDQGPFRQTLDASSITFPAEAGTVYNVAVGGWDFFGAYTGNVHLNITTGSAATPPWYPATLSLTPATADVTSAAVPVTAAFTIVAKDGARFGTAGAGFGWERTNGDGRFAGPPANWSGATPQAVVQQFCSVPRYSYPGEHNVWFKVIPAGGGDTLIFSSPAGGSGYALPSAATQSISVVNTGPVDEEAPVLTVFSISPGSVDVTTAPGTLQVSASFTDDTAGVAAVEVTLTAEDAGVHLTKQLTLTTGTALSGTWTGNIPVPLQFPTGNYAALVRAVDVAQNEDSWGSQGTTEIPGGDVSVAVVGGSSYEIWAYSKWFSAGDAKAGLLDDADGDGKPNLLSYAFDLNPLNLSTSPGSLPVVELTGTGATRKLRITYIRRKISTGSGMSYQPEFSSSTNGIWETVSGGTAVSISSGWERVTVEDTVTTSSEISRYGRVKVEYTAP